MQGKLSLKVNSFHLLEIDCSKFNCPTDDSPWRLLIFLTPTVTGYKDMPNELGEATSIYGMYIPTIMEFTKEIGVIWGFTIQILGFGVSFYSQVGY